MTRSPAPLPEELGEVFTLAEARRAGVADHRLRGSDLESPFRLVYRRVSTAPAPQVRQSAHAPPEWKSRHLQLAQAFTKIMDPDSFFCGRTAALLWGLPVPRRSSDALEVGRLAPLRATRRGSVRGIQVRPGLVELRRHRGLILTSPATTWAMLAAQLSVEELIVVGDAIVFRPRYPGTQRLKREPLGTLDELRETMENGRRRGILRLREAFPQIREASASPPETHMRLRLIDAGLPEPELDFDVRDREGRLLGCSEAAYPEYRLAFEYESEHHRVDRAQWNRDIEKYHDYAEAGWSVIRSTADLLYRRTGEFQRLAREGLLRAGWDPRRSCEVLVQVGAPRQ
jgi:hypothetical protein